MLPPLWYNISMYKQWASQRRFIVIALWATLGLMFVQAGLLPVKALHRPQTTTQAMSSAKVPFTRTITFRYVPTQPAQTVCVAGTFNDWNKSSYPLKLQPDGKTWVGTYPIPPGVYYYRFVINGNTWVNDPNAPGVDDGNSNINSLLVVEPEDYDRYPARIGDGIITPSAVLHHPDRSDITRLGERRFAFALRTRHNDVAQCFVLIQKANGGTASYPMQIVLKDPLYDRWRGSVDIPSLQPTHYAFLLKDGPTELRYDASGRLAATNTPPRWFTLEPTAYPLLVTPQWPRDAVFYQIFPDRFANGDPSNDGPDVQPWGTKPTGTNRMGGDLQGVLQHLDYLKSLGINALYFNPLFTARSNHGYDTTDYYHVDPRFGTNALLRKLVDRVHAMGWHVILDGVFNHTGIDFFAFKSLREEGPRSPYRNWYFIYKFPIVVAEGQRTYEGWFGVPWLPKLNQENPATRDYFLHVGTYWIREAHIDGWRLDAADQVVPSFWQAFRKAVKSVNPNAYLVGEIWGDAHAWLQGDEFDSVMDYPWRAAVLDFFVFDTSTPSRFDQQLAQIRDSYPPAADAVLFNLLGSHDTVRLRTLCQDNWPKERQAVLFQMTYPGTPCVYYGDEIGMEGGKDPDDRRCMEWNPQKWNRTILQFFKQAIALRRNTPALRYGDYRTIVADDNSGLFGFERTWQRSRVLVLFNRSDRSLQQTLPLSEVSQGPHPSSPVALHTLLATNRARAVWNGNLLQLQLGPRGAIVLETQQVPKEPSRTALSAKTRSRVGR